MDLQGALSGVLAALHDATVDDALWPRTSALIDAACGTTWDVDCVPTSPLGRLQKNGSGTGILLGDGRYSHLRSLEVPQGRVMPTVRHAV